MGLQKVSLTRGTVERSPRATTGMAVGAQVPQPQPAAIPTAPMGAAVPGSVHRVGATMARGHRLGWRRRQRGRRGRVLLTPGAMGPLGQSCKRFGFMASLASWGLGWRDRLARGRSGVGPQPAEHQKYIHQSNKPELVEKESWYHGNAPQRMVEGGHCNGFLR